MTELTERDETRSRLRAVGPSVNEPAVNLESLLSSGQNALLSAALPLLLLAGRLRGQISMPDPQALLHQSIQEVRAFEDRARRAGISEEDVLAARYALCTAVDEAAMNTPWGARSDWAGMKDPRRLDFTGMGPSEPRYTPVSTPANRARNRRVEIVHSRNR